MKPDITINLNKVVRLCMECFNYDSAKAERNLKQQLNWFKNKSLYDLCVEGNGELAIKFLKQQIEQKKIKG